MATVPTRFDRTPVDQASAAEPAGPAAALNDEERALLGDLFTVIEEHAGPGSPGIDHSEVERAFVFACEHHADQRRGSGEDFITHPIAVAKICAGMRLDTETLVAALLHDTVEDTSATLDEVRAEFGDEVARLVDGVTKLTGITFQSRDEKEVGISAAISGRAKHFYSIYTKMTKKGREFNEIYDLTAMRVLVDTVKDCYGAIGVIHSLWKPLPGRFKDMIAMPKFNMYQALHTTVIGPEGRPLEIQIRTREMHDTAEFGIAAHWLYKDKYGEGDKSQAQVAADKTEWLKRLLDWQKDLSDPQEFTDTFKRDLFEDEVFIFTPKGEVKSLPAGATPLDFAYEIHTDVGHR